MEKANIMQHFISPSIMQFETVGLLRGSELIFNRMVEAEAALSIIRRLVSGFFRNSSMKSTIFLRTALLADNSVYRQKHGEF